MGPHPRPLTLRAHVLKEMGVGAVFVIFDDNLILQQFSKKK